MRTADARSPAVPQVPFSAGITSGLLSYLVMFGVCSSCPSTSTGRRARIGRAGLELMAMPLALGVTAPFRAGSPTGSAPVSARWGAWLAAFGWWLSRFSTPAPGSSWGSCRRGSRDGFFTPSNNAAIMGSVPPDQSGVASGVLNMTRARERRWAGGHRAGLWPGGRLVDRSGGRGSGRRGRGRLPRSGGVPRHGTGVPARREPLASDPVHMR